jgi:hypothetical protein
LSEAQQRARKNLENETNGLPSDIVVSREVLEFPQQLPLLQRHEIWFTSARPVNLNFGERMLTEEWSAYTADGNGKIHALGTAKELREDIVRLGLSGTASGQDPREIFRSLLQGWADQTVKVPLLNIDLRYAYAVILLAAVSVLQLLWLARALVGAKVEDDPVLFGRLSLKEQLRSASGMHTSKIIAVLDWLSLMAAGAIALGAPLVCFVCAVLVRLLTQMESIAVYGTGVLALLSVGLSLLIVRRLGKLLSALSLFKQKEGTSSE